MMEIVDNFLNEKDFNTISNKLMGQSFPWYFSKGIRGKNHGMFFHKIYMNHIPTSDFYHSYYFPMIHKKLKISVLFRIHANLNYRLPEPFFNEFHTDIHDGDISLADQPKWTTSLYYINTNNGYTELEDGTKVENIANRLVSFSANTRHRVVTQTDEQTRVLINFNYFTMP